MHSQCLQELLGRPPVVLIREEKICALGGDELAGLSSPIPKKLDKQKETVCQQLVRVRMGQSSSGSTNMDHTAASMATASHSSRGPVDFLACGKMQSWSHAFGPNPPRSSRDSCSAFLRGTSMQQMMCLAA